MAKKGVIGKLIGWARHRSPWILHLNTGACNIPWYTWMHETLVTSRWWQSLLHITMWKGSVLSNVAALDTPTY